MFDYDDGECDPRTVTLIDHYVMAHVVRLAKERKFVHDGAHTLISEEEYNHHNEDAYLGTTCLTVILTRRSDGYYLTYKKSYETDYDCSYDYYIYEEKMKMLPDVRGIFKSAFSKREDHYLY